MPAEYCIRHVLIGAQPTTGTLAHSDASLTVLYRWIPSDLMIAAAVHAWVINFSLVPGGVSVYTAVRGDVQTFSLGSR